MNARNSTMQTIPYSRLRRKLEALLDQVATDGQPLVITRGRGKPAVVLAPFEDFMSWEETFHLLRSPANAARLREVIEEFEKGVGTERKLIE
jgi:antitoxin YefM